MNTIFVLVEGPTEEAFINKVLSPHLLTKGIYAIPKLVTTQNVKDGPSFKGGLGSYEKVKNEITKLLRDTSVILVTTMLDFYGLPKGFPSFSSIPKGNCYSKVEFLEQAFNGDIDHTKFLPYLSLHEFESLLFVAPELISKAFPGTKKDAQLMEIKRKYHNSPEEINDNPATAPSKRLKSIFPAYKKTLHGPLVTNKIGLDRIRAECPHFNEWLTRLEKL